MIKLLEKLSFGGKKKEMKQPAKPTKNLEKKPEQQNTKQDTVSKKTQSHQETQTHQKKKSKNKRRRRRGTRQQAAQHTGSEQETPSTQKEASTSKTEEVKTSRNQAGQKTKEFVYISPEEERAREKLNALCEQAIVKLHEKGITCLDQYGRINMDEFAETHGESIVKKDSDRIEELEKKFEETAIKRKSEYLEMIVLIVFTKCIENIAALRTAKSDDYFNGVDSVFINLENNEIVAGSDEVLPNQTRINRRENLPRHLQEEYDVASESKFSKVMRKNESGGATLKYMITKGEEGFTPSATAIEGVPLVHLSIAEEDVIGLISRMDPKINKISRTDRYIFDHLVKATQASLEEILAKSNQAEQKALRRCGNNAEEKKSVKEKYNIFRSRVETSLETFKQIEIPKANSNHK